MAVGSKIAVGKCPYCKTPNELEYHPDCQIIWDAYSTEELGIEALYALKAHGDCPGCGENPLTVLILDQ